MRNASVQLLKDILLAHADDPEAVPKDDPGAPESSSATGSAPPAPGAGAAPAGTDEQAVQEHPEPAWPPKSWLPRTNIMRWTTPGPRQVWSPCKVRLLVWRHQSMVAGFCWRSSGGTYVPGTDRMTYICRHLPLRCLWPLLVLNLRTFSVSSRLMGFQCHKMLKPVGATCCACAGARGRLLAGV